MPIRTATHPKRTKVRAALLHTASDIPTTRKLDGFLKCRAKEWCTKKSEVDLRKGKTEVDLMLLITYQSKGSAGGS